MRSRMRRRKKGLIALVLAVCAAGLSITAIWLTLRLPEGTAMRVGRDPVSYDLVYFYSRYIQQQMKEALGDKYTDDFWQQTMNSKGKVYGSDLKQTAQRDLIELYMVRQHAGTYGVALTPEEQEEISRRALQYTESLGDELKGRMYAQVYTIEEFLSLIRLEQKAYEPIVDTLPVEVSDEECAQKRYSYVFFQNHSDSVDEFGNTKLLSEPELKLLKIQAENVRERASETGDFEAAAKECGRRVEFQTFGRGDQLHRELLEALAALKPGEYGPVVETVVGYYVIRLDSECDRDATEEKKKWLLERKRKEAYSQLLKVWRDETFVRSDKRMWDLFDMELPPDALLPDIEDW